MEAGVDSPAGQIVQLGALRFERPVIMGILNVTPDSFSDGGRFEHVETALAEAGRMLEAGAGIIDIGGESTRPGAAAVGTEAEINRVVPVIEALRRKTDSVISIDTSKAEVMRAAVAAGADMINDVRALREPDALEAAAALEVPVCLMHMQGQPRSMQENPVYENIVADVLRFLEQRVERCVQAGIDRQRLAIDPGFGFGKTVTHNIALLANLRELRALGRPLLAGLSRKSTLGALTGRSVDQRMPASIAAALLAYVNGADILRVHDVGETRDALRIATATERYGE
ncbi:MAG: dihydropteroate synthase [Pseudomonadota bacterium]